MFTMLLNRKAALTELPARLKGYALTDPLRTLLWCCSLLPPSGMVLVIISFSQNLPSLEGWLFESDAAIAAHDGTLTISNLVAQFNGQRFIIDRAMTAVLSMFTHWNLLLVPYVNLIFSILTFCAAI